MDTTPTFRVGVGDLNISKMVGDIGGRLKGGGDDADEKLIDGEEGEEEVGGDDEEGDDEEVEGEEFRWGRM